MVLNRFRTGLVAVRSFLDQSQIGPVFFRTGLGRSRSGLLSVGSFLGPVFLRSGLVRSHSFHVSVRSLSVSIGLFSVSVFFGPVFVGLDRSFFGLGLFRIGPFSISVSF